jgi:hypothetical protein
MNTTPLIITVQRVRKGYTLQHNQPSGWMGTMGPRFGWYKEKEDAEGRAKELMQYYN